MPAGDGAFDDLERVAVRAADGRPILAQLMRGAGERLVDDDEFGH